GCDRRRLAPLHGADARSDREHQDLRARAEEVRDGSGLAPDRAAATFACRRSLPGDRSAAWPDGLLRGRPAEQRRGAAARAGPLFVLLQSERDERGLPRLPDRGCAGDCGQHGFRDGGSGSLIFHSASSKTRSQAWGTLAAPTTTTVIRRFYDNYVRMP